jgi:homoserine dehydrogenase
MTLRIGLAGLGTVGAGVLRLLRDNADIVTARAGRPVVVTAVSARSRWPPTRPSMPSSS